VSNVIALNEYVYNLLIKKGFNKFTVTELRNALLKQSKEFKNKDEARRFIYRHLVRLVKKRLLIKQEKKSPKNTIYLKTELFDTTVFIGGGLSQTERKFYGSELYLEVREEDSSFLQEILKEKLLHEIDLATLEGEIEEYMSLIERFPEQKKSINELYCEAKKHSVRSLGKVNALTKIYRSSLRTEELSR